MMALAMALYVVIGGLVVLYAVTGGVSDEIRKAPAVAKIIGIAACIAAWPALVAWACLPRGNQ